MYISDSCINGYILTPANICVKNCDPLLLEDECSITRPNLAEARIHIRDFTYHNDIIISSTSTQMGLIEEFKVEFKIGYPYYENAEVMVKPSPGDGTMNSTVLRLFLPRVYINTIYTFTITPFMIDKTPGIASRNIHHKAGEYQCSEEDAL